jgi:DNA polymerase/3'-5' exonuclease PolX
MLNENLIKQFTLLISQIKKDINDEHDKKKAIKNKFRLRKFESFLNLLKKYKTEIKKSSELEDVPNVGQGIIDRVNEILKTGALKEVKKTKDTKEHLKKIEQINSLTQIINVGESLAKKLYDQGATSPEILKQMVADGDIEINSKVKLGLKYYGKVKENIPRSEMDLINKYLLKQLEKFNDEDSEEAESEGILCGSYRRKQPKSNDIDFLIMDCNTDDQEDIDDHQLLDFVDFLKKDGFIIDDMTPGKVTTKYMGFCRLDNKHDIRRIDIRLFSQNSFPAAVLYFTGSKLFNQKMRATAEKLGYLLNEYGLYKLIKKNGTIKKKFVEVDTEKEIFEILKMKYVKPENRNM